MAAPDAGGATGRRGIPPAAMAIPGRHFRDTNQSRALRLSLTCHLEFLNKQGFPAFLPQD
jgi:hypothetical protein